jgi:elongation factor P hydroxylase
MNQTQTQTQAQKKEFVPVEIRPETRRWLAVVKAKYGFRSYDELIRDLLRRAGYADQ